MSLRKHEIDRLVSSLRYAIKIARDEIASDAHGASDQRGASAAYTADVLDAASASITGALRIYREVVKLNESNKDD